MSLMLFAALAGAVQIVAPDRWMPASVFAWQRGWSFKRIAPFSILIFAVHVVLGFGLYFLLSPVLVRVPEASLGIFTLVFLSTIGLIRALRFSRLREVLFRGPKSLRVVFSVLSLLGPSEMVIPVLMKAKIDGVPILPVLASFGVGTLIAGLAGLSIARARWNKPFALPRAVHWGQSKVAALPMAAGALVGVLLIVFHVI